MMKKIILLSIIAICFYFNASAQIEVTAKLEEAESQISSGNLEEARFALQQSLVELDRLIGEEILKLLPSELSALSADKENDELTGGAGIAGIFVERLYLGDTKSIRIEIITNSPIMAMVTAALNNPLLATMSGGDQKIVKIAGYKSLVEKTEGQYGQQHDVKIPIKDSMITIAYDGFSQNESIEISNSLKIKEIVNLVSSSQ